MQKKTVLGLTALAVALAVFVLGCLFWVAQLSRPTAGNGVLFSEPFSSAVSSEESSAAQEPEQAEPVSQAEETSSAEPIVVATAETPVVVQEAAAVTQTFSEEKLEHETSLESGGTTIEPISPNFSSAASSAASSASSASSESSSDASATSSDSGAASARSALDEALQMPDYTPSGITLAVTWKGSVYYADAVTVLSGLVQAEIVGGVRGTPNAAYAEAYKAQAVAGHSYIAYYNNRGKAPSVYLQVPHSQTVAYVAQVASQMVYYEGSPIEAVYCASAGGHTVSSREVWGGSVAYLVGVESKYDESDSTVSITADALKEKLLAKKSTLDLSGDPSEWLTITSTGTDGVVTGIKIGGSGGSVTVKGNTFRESYLSSVRSPKFTVSYDSATGTFTFTARGYGHCVGMSQIGARGYAANEGWSYVQILTHYYSGTSVS